MTDNVQAESGQAPASRTSGIRMLGRGANRGLVLLIAGAVVLIVAGLISIPLLARRTPTLAAPTTPEGVVQRFYQALYGGDYATAYSSLSADTQRKVSVAELQQGMSGDLRDTQIRTGKVTVTGDKATVPVTTTHFSTGGLLSTNEWTSDSELLLQQEAGLWKIVSGFGYFPKLTGYSAP
jgi:hypothetical protein